MNISVRPVMPRAVTSVLKDGVVVAMSSMELVCAVTAPSTAVSSTVVVEKKVFIVNKCIDLLELVSLSIQVDRLDVYRELEGGSFLFPLCFRFVSIL